MGASAPTLQEDKMDESEEIDRLRTCIADWVNRLQWADGLTDVVEDMRKEAKEMSADDSSVIPNGITYGKESTE